MLYEIHVATGSDVAAGRATLSYQFQFTTSFKNAEHDPPVVSGRDSATSATRPEPDADLHRHQGRPSHPASSTIARQRHRAAEQPRHRHAVLQPGRQRREPGEGRRRHRQRSSIATPAESITELDRGYVAFAGQRDDGFYGDIQSIFDLLQLRSPGKDSQGGFNIHLMALEIPVTELGGDQQVVGVYATTSRRQRADPARGRRSDRRAAIRSRSARQGNPLFNEGLVAIADKDLYSRTSPTRDSELFANTR